MEGFKEVPTQAAKRKSAQFIRGIGPRRFEALKRLGIETVRDLCYFFPRRYEDRANFQSITELEPGVFATIRGEVQSITLKPLKRMTLVEVIISDLTDSIAAIWFNQPYLKNQFQEGDRLILSGKVDRYQDRLQMNSPEYERDQDNEEDGTHTGRIIPVYPLTEGLIQRSLRQAMKEVVDHHIPKEIREFLPDSIRKRNHLMPLHHALQVLHFPDDWDKRELARKRIVFDEFFIFELLLLSKLSVLRAKEQGAAIQHSPERFNEFKQVLAFEFTGDQVQAIEEIAQNVGQTLPMNRLLQGEVGTGKTVVAAYLLFLAVKSGLQAALIAPTEILAQQHFETLEPLYKKLGIACSLLTGSSEEIDRVRVYQHARKGDARVFIGTHALLQEDVHFKELGLVVIDEQHRFGVEQRGKLVSRTPRPHLLVMTATPIPRTLGLTLYGDLDITTIREQPKGRKKIKTYWIHQAREQEVLAHIRDKIKNSDEQAYILFPIIEETERSDLQAASQEFKRLQKGIFSELKVGLVHGRLNQKKRERVMKSFHSGKIKVLVTTSIIEVGVDNPNVTFMVIENAERFGLSQLHQMRGRIGRGTKESMCFLFGHPNNEDGKKRLRILTKTNDGFTIAEEDLAMRGPGDFFGTRQSGVSFFRVANLTEDVGLLLAARKEATELLAKDPQFVKPAHRLLADEVSNWRVQIEL